MKQKLQKGFTLIELVIYAGLLALLLTMFVTLVVSIMKNERLLGHRTRVAQETAFTMRTIVDTLRTAKQINPAGLSLNQSDFSKDSYSRLAFTVGAEDQYFTVNSAVYPYGLVLNTPGGAKILTTPAVRVEIFRADCIGAPCGSNPKSVRITLQLADIESGEFLTATTSVTPRGF